jgi:hypothetical protein
MEEYKIALTNKALSVYMQHNHTKLLTEFHEQTQKFNKLLYSIKNIEKYKSSSICYSCYDHDIYTINSICCGLCYVRNCKSCVKNTNLVYGSCSKCCRYICNNCVPDIKKETISIWDNNSIYSDESSDDSDYICPKCSINITIPDDSVYDFYS